MLHWSTWPPRSACWVCDPDVAADAVADSASDWEIDAEFEPVMLGHVALKAGGLDGEILVGQAVWPVGGPLCWIRKLCVEPCTCATMVAPPASSPWDVVCETFATFGPEVVH